MMEELRFAVRCHGSAKKPKQRRHCSQCAIDGGAICPPAGGGGVAAAAGEPSPNGVLLAQSTAGSTLRRSSIMDDRLHYGRSARVDCDYAVDRRRTSTRCTDLDYADRRPSGTSDLRRDTAKTPDCLARSFAKV